MVLGHSVDHVIADLAHHGIIFGIGLVAGLSVIVWAVVRGK